MEQEKVQGEATLVSAEPIMLEGISVDTPFSTLVRNIANLFKVKSLITLAVISTFVVITLRGDVTGSEFLTVLGSIIGYFFGTKNPETK